MDSTFIEQRNALLTAIADKEVTPFSGDFLGFCAAHWNNLQRKADLLSCLTNLGMPYDVRRAFSEAVEQIAKAIPGDSPGRSFEDDPMAFPTEAFPEALQPFIREVAASLPCPEDYPGVLMLPVLGVAIGTSYEIGIKRSWKEPAILWAALLADQGQKKSPALTPVTKPLFDIQDAYAEEFKKLLKEWDSDPDKKGRPPTMRQILCTDTTVEGLAPVLSKNPHGLLIARDELTGWTRSMNQYKAGGADRQDWLSFWNRAPVMVNRKTQTEVYLRNPFVAVGGIMPPSVLNLLNESGHEEDGFTSRILFSWPKPLEIDWSDHEVSAETEAAYEDVITSLMRLSPAEDGRPRVLPLGEGAREAFIETVKGLHKETRSSDFPPVLKGPWRKLEGYLARLSLILHLTNYACGTADLKAIEEEAVVSASLFLEYFKAHARRAYGVLSASNTQRKCLMRIDIHL